MGWPIGLANDGLAQTRYELYDLVEHRKDPDPTPVSLVHLFHTHAHDPLSLVTSMSLRRRRSPPRPLPANSVTAAGRICSASSCSSKPSLRFDFYAPSCSPMTPETLVVNGGSTIACCCSGHRRSPPMMLLPGVAPPWTSLPSTAALAPPPFPHAYLTVTLTHGWLGRRRITDSAAARLLS
jgi:hypothetical protein